jgi:hypothetical protein
MGKLLRFIKRAMDPYRTSIKPPGRWRARLEISRTNFLIEESDESYVFQNCLSVRIPEHWPEFARKHVRKMLLESAEKIQADVGDYLTAHELTLSPPLSYRYRPPAAPVSEPDPQTPQQVIGQGQPQIPGLDELLNEEMSEKSSL